MLKRVYPLLSYIFLLALLSFSSLLSSINILHSSSQLFLWSIYGLIFLLSACIPIKLAYQKYLLLLGFAVASMLLLCHSLNSSLFSFLSTSPSQFILPIEGHNGHNHLGDFAGLAVISILVSSSHLIITIPSLIGAIAIMVISFSKSAFLGVLVVSCILAIQKRGKYLLMFFVILFISFIAIAVYTEELSGIPLIRSSQEVMSKTLHLHPKPLLSVRDFYYPQVIRAWGSAPLEQLLFGYGSGNYMYPSVKTGLSAGLTPTETHNIFLGLFIENGVLSFFWFLIFCIIIMYWGIKTGNPSVYLFIYLLANFQTDFTYSLPFFLGLFFIFAGQSLHGKEDKINIKSSFFLTCVVCIVGSTLFSGVYSAVTLKNKANLDKQLNRAVKKLDKKTVQDTIRQLELITPHEASELITWSQMSEIVGNNSEAIRLLEKISLYSPRAYLTFLPNQLDLQKKEEIDIKKYLKSKNENFKSFPYTQEEKDEFNNICQDYAKMKCIN